MTFSCESQGYEASETRPTWIGEYHAICLESRSAGDQGPTLPCSASSDAGLQVTLKFAPSVAVTKA